MQKKYNPLSIDRDKFFSKVDKGRKVLILLKGIRTFYGNF
jgi:hypothetical protein